MKTKLKILAVLLATATIANASLIDLTPGGFDETQPFPHVVSQFFSRYQLQGMQNLAGANIVNGQPVWSPFTPFGPPNVGLTLNANGTQATVDWNWLGTGFRGMFIFVESSNLIANLYMVPFLQRFSGNGSIAIDGTIPILAATFTGISTLRGVPDTGSTLLLFGLTLLGASLIYRSGKGLLW